jgi:mono/diheme cytochrome c family protein
MTNPILPAAAVLLGLLSLAACAGVPRPSDVAWGRRLAQANCARCHAIGPRGSSPNAFAPPFRELRRRYPVDELNATFTPYTLSGHAPMPDFAARADELADLLAYVRSVQEPGSDPWPPPAFAACGRIRLLLAACR